MMIYDDSQPFMPASLLVYFPEITDISLLVFFVLMWLGYGYLADHRSTGTYGLVGAMYRYRYKWMSGMPERLHNDRLVDIRIINNLIQATNFLASTSILIIGGLIAALLDGGQSLGGLQKAHLIPPVSITEWALKTGTAVTLFVYAFFKLTWVTRQFNYTAVLIMAVPHIPRPHDTEAVRKRVRVQTRRITLMLTNSAQHFNRAVRAFYFGLALICWYVNDIAFIVACIWVTATLYRREFRSKTLQMVRM